MADIHTNIPLPWEPACAEFIARIRMLAQSESVSNSITEISIYEHDAHVHVDVCMKPRKRLMPTVVDEIKELKLHADDAVQHVCQHCGHFGHRHSFDDGYDEILCEQCAREMHADNWRFPKIVGRAAPNVVQMPNPHEPRIRKIVGDFMRKAVHLSHKNAVGEIQKMNMESIFSDLHRLHAKRQSLTARFAIYEALRDFHERKESGQT